jgi:hypothetical protein
MFVGLAAWEMRAMRCCRQAGVGTAARRSVGARDANDEGSFKRCT